MQKKDLAALCENGALERLDVDARRKALLADPTPANLALTGEALFLRGQWLDALRLALEVVNANRSNTPLVMVAAGMISKHTPCHDIVITLMRNVLLHEPDHLQARLTLADELVAQGDIAEGCRLYRDIMSSHPEEGGSLCEHISMSLLETGYAIEGLQILSSWLEHMPETVALLNNMACALERTGHSEMAVSWYKKALEMAPNEPIIRFGYAIALLKAGHFREGGKYYTERTPLTNGIVWWFMSLPRLRHGDDIAGKKIVLYQEQGLGDTIQFIRFVPYLLEKGAEITIATLPPLVRLLTLSFPDVTVTQLTHFDRAEGYSYAVPIPDLPFVADIGCESDIPARIPYLRADEGDVQKFAAMLPARRPRIGLVWAGERRMQAEFVAADKRRSATLADMGAALTPVDATLINLQFGAPCQEITAWQGQPLFDPMGEVRDMADTLALMESLDLIISVDTSPVHLAGAIGRPVWLVSRWDACWRWGDEGETSAWYPSVRIFRARERSFVPVLKEVGAALQQWVKDWKPD
ncbi:glycosyltransferase [Komagataeibacter sp. FNDCR2]|uniref:glycosyltransferase n=1 Tax=Komagataeibacter sp. FNDCR2 TaxID=2878682 RepID=UPI001E390B8D|nr:glycosyltransferase [Komagataeibacter sp. FNDCR2]MCE2576818.1 glycosyltransferase [Komagataeibacter sp. FNDCR2]